MAKWADFCISAVRYDADHKHIVEAKVYVDNGESLNGLTEKRRTTIVSEIEGGKSYVTIVANSEGNWNKGQPVKIVLINGKKYIKTVDNKKESDNLENLPEY